MVVSKIYIFLTHIVILPHYLKIPHVFFNYYLFERLINILFILIISDNDFIKSTGSKHSINVVKICFIRLYNKFVFTQQMTD